MQSPIDVQDRRLIVDAIQMQSTMLRIQDPDFGDTGLKELTDLLNDGRPPIGRRDNFDRHIRRYFQNPI